jgi:hypothetical protein
MEHRMILSYKSLSVAAIVSALCVAPGLAQTTGQGGAMKLSQAQCTSVWSKIDGSQSGSVTQTAGSAFVTDFKAVDTNNDGKLSQAEFTAGCDKGLIRDTASTGSGSGTTK